MIISTPVKFIIEISHIPVYQRIINTFKKALLEIGHTVSIIETQNLSSTEEYILMIKRENPDFIISIDPFSILSNYADQLGDFIFETLDIPIIFVHYDNIFSNLYDANLIKTKLISFYNIKDISWHFCLEYDNILDLKKAGINNVFPIYHVVESHEFTPAKEYRHEVSFLGHVLPSLSLTVNQLASTLASRFCADLQSQIWRRISNLDTSLSFYANEFAINQLIQVDDTFNFLSAKYFYLSLLHLQSQGFRGEIIQSINNVNIDIIGGSPAYIHGGDSNEIIIKDNIKYYPPQNNNKLIKGIYQSSQINLNITSLQFDDAVINRVTDIAAIGGFILTDWRSDLESLTIVYEEISYKSIEELNEKTAYYLHPDHYQERLDIAEILHQDIHQNCNYISMVEYMISQINTSKKYTT